MADKISYNRFSVYAGLYNAQMKMQKTRPSEGITIALEGVTLHMIERVYLHYDI